MDALPPSAEGDDPWMSLVMARRLLDDGRLAAAAVAAERAGTRFVDPVGAGLCDQVVATARAWTAPAPHARPAQRGRHGRSGASSWTAAVRAATMREPLAVARHAETSDLPTYHLVRGVAAALAGDFAAARPALERCAAGPDDDPVPTLAARFALALADAVSGPGAGHDAELERVAAEADRRGLTWLARVAHGTAVSLSPTAAGSEDEDEPPPDVLVRLVSDCDQRGDHWGALVVSGAAALGRLRAGDLDTGPMERLAARCRDLDAGVLEAWARSAHAVLAGLVELPDALVVGQSAESFARSAAVPGAVCLAYAALALADTEQREEMQVLTTVSATASGLGPPPWRWLGQVGGVLADGLVRGPRAGARLPGTVGAADEGVGTRVPGPRGQLPPVTLRCLGELRLVVGGDVLDLSSVQPRARSVLRILAVHAGRTVHREQLADALWPHVERPAALHTLQVHLSRLRAMLSPGAGRGAGSLIVRDGEAYGLAMPEGSTSDVLELERAVAEARKGGVGPDGCESLARALRRAVEAYGGDLVPEEGPAEWAVALREHYRVLAAGAAAQLAELELQRGDAVAAAAAATRSVEIDECQDAAWRTLVQAYRASGNPAAAGRAQLRYADVLLDLGVDPDPWPVTATPVPADRVTDARGTPPRRAPREQPDPALGTRTRS
jgi:DNA-binding SARP family transcriptional activator